MVCSFRWWLQPEVASQSCVRWAGEAGGSCTAELDDPDTEALDDPDRALSATSETSH
ncbi:hypothetical protein [Corynebacterium sp. HS2168-gen11]|uniref:hypothetical protein n=1 Tax=Corynebacterium sp. HS2168-gen11 TaxID=2974027 RepID=UPI00216AB3F5|nr:hypothetical protein [Corynebacterium sp. HS2168-gen11]MCS4536467.1 hypothetical protein [Corynebacterium sp. HS2168-gen11]